MAGWVDATGRGISWVEFAGNVGSREGGRVWECLSECMDPFEAFIDGSISAPGIPPTFDDAFVVTVYFKMSVSAWSPGEGAGE